MSWSTVGAFTNFQVLTTDQAGSFRIPIGSKCMGGMAVANQDIIWTDVDVWAMNYLGPPLVFGFNKIGGICRVREASKDKPWLSDMFYIRAILRNRAAEGVPYHRRTRGGRKIEVVPVGCQCR